jgi:hypothetical protein
VIKYEVGSYLPRYGHPTLVTVIEVHETEREWIEENYAFLPDSLKALGSRFRTDYSKVDFPAGHFSAERLIEEAQRRTQFLVENFVFDEGAAAYRDLFLSSRPFTREPLAESPFVQFKLYDQFVPEMRTIAKSTDSEELSALLKQALKAPSLRRTFERLF